MPTDAKNKRYVIHYDIHNNTRITNINEKLTHINEKCNFQRFNTVIRRLNLAIITFLKIIFFYNILVRVRLVAVITRCTPPRSQKPLYPP